MKDVARLADTIALNFEKTAWYFKRNWQPMIVAVWMILVTFTLLLQQTAIEKASSITQVGNLGMAVGDIRYSVKAMETHVEQMQRSVIKMDHTVNVMDTTVNRIHAQVRNKPDSE